MKKIIDNIKEKMEFIEAKNLYLFVFFCIISFVIFSFSYTNLNFFWDDDRFIFGNPSFMQAPSWYAFWDDSSDFYKSWPLGYAIFWFLVKKISFLTNASFKTLNILFHALNAFLIFHYLKKLKFKHALIPTLVFLVHPLNVETVSWIFQLLTILALTFLLFSLILFNDFLAKPKLHLILLSYALFLCSLWTKSIAILAPFLFLTTLWINKSTAKYYLIILPYFALSLFVGMANIRGSALLVKKRDNTTSFAFLNFFKVIDEGVKTIIPIKGSKITEDLSTQYFDSIYKKRRSNDLEFERIKIFKQGTWHYFSQTLLPLKLTYIYENKIVPIWKVILSISFVILLPLFFFFKNRERLMLLVPSMAIVSILPYLGVSYITFFYWSNVSDRYTYFFLFMFSVVSAIFLRSISKIKLYLLSFYLIFLSVQAVIYCEKFNNPLKLYASILSYKKHPVIYSLLFEQYLLKLDKINAKKILNEGLSEFPEDESLNTDVYRLNALEQSLK